MFFFQIAAPALVVILLFAGAHTKSLGDEKLEYHTLTKRSNKGSQCKVNVKNDLNTDYPPMIISLKESQPEFLYPSVDDPTSIVVPSHEIITVFCSGKTNRKSTEEAKPGTILINAKETESVENLECSNSDSFTVPGVTKSLVQLKDVSCLEKTKSKADKEPSDQSDKTGKYSYDAILRETKEKCGPGAVYEIGFDLGDDRFLRTIDLCHDQSEHVTLWAHSTVIPVNQQKYRFTGGVRKPFKAGSIYDGIKMASGGPYEIASQYKTIQDIFKDEAKTKQYVSTATKDRQYLARGHLIANADKFYKSEQDSTYFYANVVPMWQQINAVPGNWYFIEELVRNLAFQKKTELDIWAGGVGTMELENDSDFSGKKKPANAPKYLVLNGKIPVPQVIYKCVVDKTNKEALCFLVVNNPYLSLSQVEASPKKYVICKKHDLCEKINPNFSNTKNGYMYCCKVKDFYAEHGEELGLEGLADFQSYKELTLKLK